MKMRFSALIAAAALLSTAAATATVPQRAVIVTYAEDTPESVLDEAKDAIKAAGGVVTQEYRLIKAFAANASVEALDLVKIAGAKFMASVEEDQVVKANGDH